MLSYELSAAAVREKSTIAAAGFNLSALALLFVLVAPPVAFGGGVDAVGTAGEVTAEAVQIVLVILFFGYGGREWAGAPPPEPDSATAEPKETETDPGQPGPDGD